MELSNLTIRKASELLEKKEVSSVKLTKYYLDRIKKYDNKIGAFLLVSEKYALKKAKEADKRIAAGKRLGILDGIPFGVKDVIVTEGLETTAASKVLEGFNPPFSATVVKKLEDAGAVILGKLNCDEFAMGGSTENSAYKVCRNPWDMERVPGGSSGGSASALSADLCVFALGTDTGGSVRQPASFCSVVGLKPTYGRNSRYGAIPYGSSLDQIAPMAKNVEDIAIVMEVMAGVDPLDSTTVDVRSGGRSSGEAKRSGGATSAQLTDIKIGVPREYFGEGIDFEVKKVVMEAVDKYKEMGAKIVDVSLPMTEYAIPTYYLIAMAEASSNLARYDGIKYGKSVSGGRTSGSIALRGPTSALSLIDVYFKTRGKYLGDEQKRKSILGTYELSAGYYDAYYRKAQKARALIKKDFDDIFTKVDCLMTPASPFPAFKIGEKKDDPLSMYLADIYTISPNLAGICAIVLPAGFVSSGLPVGLQIMGTRFEEGKILSIAKAYEDATEWHKKYPEIK